MTINTTFQSLRNNVAQLAQWTEEALTDLASQISAGWNVEHDGDGHHTDVTATSITAPQITATGRFVFSAIERIGLSASTADTPLYLANPAANFLWIRPKSGGSSVRGLSNIGRQDGDIILIYNIGNADLTLKLLDATTPVGTQFNENANVSEPTPGDYVLGPAGLTFAVYSKHEFFNKSYWNLLSVRTS